MLQVAVRWLSLTPITLYLSSSRGFPALPPSCNSNYLGFSLLGCKTIIRQTFHFFYVLLHPARNSLGLAPVHFLNTQAKSRAGLRTRRCALPWRWGIRVVLSSSFAWLMRWSSCHPSTLIPSCWREQMGTGAKETDRHAGRRWRYRKWLSAR